MARKHLYTIVGSFDGFVSYGQEYAKGPKKALGEFLAGMTPTMITGHGLEPPARLKKWFKKLSLDSEEHIPSVWGTSYHSKRGHYIYFTIVRTRVVRGRSKSRR